MEPLVESSGKKTMRCPVGDMPLSQAMHRMLTGLIDGSVEVDVRKSSTRWGVGGKWFCPRDRGQLVEVEGIVRCPQCQLNLTGALYQLIEHHNHSGSGDDL